MTDAAADAWTRIRAALATDSRVGPQLQGFISLVEPKGVVKVTRANGHLSEALLPRRIDEKPKRRGPDVVSIAFYVDLIVFDVISLQVMGVWIFA